MISLMCLEELMSHCFIAAEVYKGRSDVSMELWHNEIWGARSVMIEGVYQVGQYSTNRILGCCICYEGISADYAVFLVCLFSRRILITLPKIV
jgi:hypothetical protein